jgi:hypothetical protein
MNILVIIPTSTCEMVRSLFLEFHFLTKSFWPQRCLQDPKSKPKSTSRTQKFLYVIWKWKSKGEVVPVLCHAAHHDGEWGSWGIAPHILNLSTRWGWLVSFVPWPLCPLERACSTHWVGSFVGPRAVLDMVTKRKRLNPGHPAHILVTTDWLLQREKQGN